MLRNIWLLRFKRVYLYRLYGLKQDIMIVFMYQDIDLKWACDVYSDCSDVASKIGISSKTLNRWFGDGHIATISNRKLKSGVFAVQGYIYRYPQVYRSNRGAKQGENRFKE